MLRISQTLAMFAACLLIPMPGVAQDQSVNPGVNDSFRDPNVEEFLGKFEVESREVFLRREEILAACDIRPGQTVADIGAGTGLFTRPFAVAVGKQGGVIAVDISQRFLDHITTTSRAAGLSNIDTLLCNADSTELPENTVDVAFICDTYHHFEFPHKTLRSLFRAMKAGGRLVLIDFRRVEGESSDWVMGHVRAGQEVFEKEIAEAGFQKLSEERELLRENYFVIFQKPGHDDHELWGGAVGGRGSGMGRGMGGGGGMGRDPAMRGDQDVFHSLLEHHQKIRRVVKNTATGVETLTESDNPEIADKIQEHVASMHQRIKDGRGLRFWDDLFAAIFKNYERIEMTVENTEKGVRVTETSKDPAVALLIQAHAVVVSDFVAKGFEAAHQNHPVPVPAAARASAELAFPIIPNFGGVLPRPSAVDQPRVGTKVVFDVTNDAKANDVNKGLDRAARLLNLFGAAGLRAKDVSITVILHGESTKTILGDEAYAERFESERNPSLPLIRELQKAGVEILVCGQALNYKGIDDTEVADDIPIATAAMNVVANRQADGYSSAAMNVVANRQADGYSYIPVP